MRSGKERADLIYRTHYRSYGPKVSVGTVGAQETPLAGRPPPIFVYDEVSVNYCVDIRRLVAVHVILTL